MEKNPQVLMVIAFLDRVGGAQRQAMLLASELRALGAKIAFLTNRASGTSRKDEIQGFPVSRARFLGKWRLGHIKFHIMNLSMAREMVQRAGEFEIIHVHQGLWPAYAAVTAARKTGKPCVVKIGNTGARFDLSVLENSPLKGRAMARMVSSEADMFVATSSRAETEIREYGIEPERITRIPNGVRIPAPVTREDRLAARRSLGLPDDDPLVISVGSLEPHKRPLLLLEAFKLAAERQIKARITFIGDGSHREEIMRRTHNMGLAERVVCAREVDDVEIYMRAADIFASASSGEGMSNALLEAMAHGLPCAATSVSGSEDVIINGRNGLLISSGVAEELAVALNNLIEDASMRSALGNEARETVEAQCSIDKIAQRYLKLYASLK